MAKIVRGVKAKISSTSTRRRVVVQLTSWLEDQIKELPPRAGVIEIAFRFNEEEENRERG